MVCPSADSLLPANHCRPSLYEFWLDPNDDTVISLIVCRPIDDISASRRLGHTSGLDEERAGFPSRERSRSHEELAFEAGMHRTYISNSERGARSPTIEVIDRRVETLKVRPKLGADRPIHVPSKGTRAMKAI